MKKNLLKKIIASSVAVFAVTAMAVPSMSVFAANTPTINAAPATVLQTANSTVGIPLKKDIVLFNVDGSPILSPNVTYTYHITQANVTTATITTYAQEDLDNSGNPIAGRTPITVSVKPGIIEAVTTSAGDDTATDTIKEGTISFGAEADTINNNTNKKETNRENNATDINTDKKVTGSMTISINANKIYDPLYNTTGHTNTQRNGPGVYRYKIQDTTAANTLTASGITRTTDYNTNNAVIYLDVYTKYNDNKDGLVVYGYVFLKDDSTNHGNENVNYTAGSPETLKITGFDDDSENKDTDGDNKISTAELKSDSYHTYNVEVSKVTDGLLADTQNNFPFKVELTNTNTVTSLDDFYYVITKDGSALTEVKDHLLNNGSWTLNGSTPATNLQLQNGDKITITGLPVNTQIKVTETNNTTDTYSVSATKNGSAISVNSSTSGVSVAANATAAMDDVTPVNQTTAKDVIVFTNTLKDISVTGLLFSIAPFVFITIAGVALLVLVMKNKNRSDSKTKI